MTTNNLEARVEAIESRNDRVEKDKAWETSLLRRVLITSLTYGVVVVYLVTVDADNPFQSAVIPAGGYFMSTLVMKSIKKWWMDR